MTGVELIDDLLRTHLRDAVNRSARHRVPMVCPRWRARAARPRRRQPAGRWRLRRREVDQGRWHLEQLAAHGFELLVVDPEGDYAELDEAVVLGDVIGRRACRGPGGSEAARRRPGAEPAGVELGDGGILARLLPELSRLRGRTGRPH